VAGEVADKMADEVDYFSGMWIDLFEKP